jgi:hypothetical protein
MRSWRRQRGDVPVGCLIGFVFAVLVAIVAMKAIPAIVTVGEFDKEVKVQADRANRIDYTDKRIRDNLLFKAQELDIPINAKSIWINRTATHFKVRIAYDYKIEFPGYTYLWHKVHEEDRPLF